MEIDSSVYLCGEKKRQGYSVTDRGGPQACESSRFPHFLDSRLTDGGDVVNLTRLRATFYPPGP
jgi:hypothetical protein